MDPDRPAPEQLRRRRGVALVGLLVAVSALVAVDRVGATREQQHLADAGSLRLVVEAAVPTGEGRPGSPRQDARLDLTVRNDGPSVVRVLEQRFDGGVPVDPGPAAPVAAGATAVLPVRWRVLCAEIGGRYGPASLDLLVRTRSGEVRGTKVPLGPPLGGLRRAIRSAAVDACEVLVP